MFRLMHLYYQVFKFKADDVCFVCDVFSSFIAFLHHFKISIVFFFFCPVPFVLFYLFLCSFSCTLHILTYAHLYK